MSLLPQFGSRVINCDTSCKKPAFGDGPATPGSLVFDVKDGTLYSHVKDIADGEHIVVVFTATWCHPCRNFRANTLTPIQNNLPKWFPRIYVIHSESPGGEAVLLNREFGDTLITPLDIQAFPTTTLFKRVGEKVYAVEACRGGASIEAWLRAVEEKKNSFLVEFGAPSQPPSFGALEAIRTHDKVVIISGPSWSPFTQRAKEASLKIHGTTPVKVVDSETCVEELRQIQEALGLPEPEILPVTIVSVKPRASIVHHGFTSEEVWLKDVMAALG